MNKKIFFYFIKPVNKNSLIISPMNIGHYYEVRIERNFDRLKSAIPFERRNQIHLPTNDEILRGMP